MFHSQRPVVFKYWGQITSFDHHLSQWLDDSYSSFSLIMPAPSIEEWCVASGLPLRVSRILLENDIDVDILRDVSHKDFVGMDLMPSDIDALQRAIRALPEPPKSVAKPVGKANNAGTQKSRSDSRPKRDTESRSPIKARGKLLEEIAAEEISKPTTLKGSQSERAKQLYALGIKLSEAGEQEKAIVSFNEAEALFLAVNDNSSIEMVAVKRQHAENSVKLQQFEKKVLRDRGRSFLEEGKNWMEKGMYPRAKQSFINAYTAFTEVGDAKLAAEASRLRDGATKLAERPSEPQADPRQGSAALTPGEQEVVEQPNSLVRSALEEKEAAQREFERARAIRQQEVRYICDHNCDGARDRVISLIGVRDTRDMRTLQGVDARCFHLFSSMHNKATPPCDSSVSSDLEEMWRLSSIFIDSDRRELRTC